MLKLFKVLPTPFLVGCLLFPGYASGQEGGPAAPYKIGGGVKAPVVLTQPLPAYTPEAREAGAEGIILLQAIVRKDGTVDSLKILKGLGYGLDESAINTIATKWRFQPGTYNGNPVDVQANIEVSFRLFKNPAETESLRSYGMRVQIIDTHWTAEVGQASTGSKRGSGYGNTQDAGALLGFSYNCECNQFFGPGNHYPARWIRPGSRLEIALGFDANTGKQKTCELEVSMHNVMFSMRDGQLVTIDPSTK